MTTDLDELRRRAFPHSHARPARKPSGVSPRKVTELKGARETRAVTGGLELRNSRNAGKVKLSGYASITGHTYQVGSFRERIQPSAFKRTLANNPDVSLLIAHEGLPLARTKAG